METYQGKIAHTYELVITDNETDDCGVYGTVHDARFDTLEEALEEAKDFANKQLKEWGQEDVLPLITFDKVLSQSPTTLCAYEGWEANCLSLKFEIYHYQRYVTQG